MTDPISTKRKILKKLVASTASIVAGAPFTKTFAQANNAGLPAILELVLEEPSPESFTLSEDNYTGMATQAFQVNANSQTYELTATANICFEVISSELDETRVNIDMIVILEGLQAINALNDDIAIEYIFRNGGNALLDKSIEPGKPNDMTAIILPAGSVGNSCGYFQRFPLQVRIENFRPIVRVLEQNFTEGGVVVSLPGFEVRMAAGECTIPANRSNQNCRDPLFTGTQTTIPVGTTLAPL